MNDRFRKMLFDLTLVLAVVFGFFAFVSWAEGREYDSLIAVTSASLLVEDDKTEVRQPVKAVIKKAIAPVRKVTRVECKDGKCRLVERPLVKKFTKKTTTTVEKVRSRCKDGRCSTRRFFSRLFRRN